MAALGVEQGGAEVSHALLLEGTLAVTNPDWVEASLEEAKDFRQSREGAKDFRRQSPGGLLGALEDSWEGWSDRVAQKSWFLQAGQAVPLQLPAARLRQRPWRDPI